MKKTTLYVDLFDKESKLQKFSIVEAYEVSESVILSTDEGATISVYGIYKHDDGTVVIEPYLRIELSNLNTDQVHHIVETLKASLNQESILVEETNVTSNFR